MESNSSKILKISGILLGIFGLVSLIYYRREKNVSSNVETQKSEGKDSSQDRTEEHDECPLKKEENHQRVSFSEPEDLLRYSIKESLMADEFNSKAEFLEKVITISSLLCDNYEWFNYFPKNSSELEEVLDRYGLLQQFNVQLYNKYKK